MKQMIKKILTVMILMGFFGCSTVTIRDHGQRKLSTEPTYQESLAFYLGGLVGEHRVDVKQVCHGKTAIQMQAQSTFMDRLLAFVTLLIYTPRSVKVWCSEGGSI